MAQPGPDSTDGIPEFREIPEPEKLAAEIMKKYPVDEFVDIAVELLTHDMVKEPPALVQKYGRAMYDKGKLRGMGLSGYNFTEEQAWRMVRDEYFKKVVDDV